MFSSQAPLTRASDSATTLDQLLALLGEVMAVDFVSFEGSSIQTRWVGGDLPVVRLPLVEKEELLADARADSRYAQHPLVVAGLNSLLAMPISGGTLWLGARRTSAFDDRGLKSLPRWVQLIDRLLKPADDPGIYRRFIAMMASPAMYVNGNSVFLNRSAEQLTGYKAEEVSTIDVWFERLYGTDAQTMRGMYELDRQHHFRVSRTATVRRKDGSERMVEFSVRQEGSHEMWLLLDVTERVAAQERFRVLFEQSGTALSLYDEKGLIDCNPAAVALLGYTAKADVLHRKPSDLSPPRQPDGQPSGEKLARMEAIALTQGSHRFDWVYRALDGPEAQVEVTLTPLMLSARPVLLAEWHDIRERLRYQQGLEAARDSALAYAQARSDFLATMSHEIRTPMNGVIGMTQLLAETTLSVQQREYLDAVRSSGESLMTLINDVFDFSQLEAGKVQLSSVPFSIREIAEEALSVVASEAHIKQLELTSRVNTDTPALVWGDPARLRQVLLNLLTNAVKFTNQGSIEMTVSTQPYGPGEMLLEFSVKDTGSGITAEVLPRLFSAFNQHVNGTTRRFGGSGLGLIICRGLTQLMRGRLDFESSEQGSTFRVSLPLKVHTQATLALDLSGRSIAVLEQRPASRAALVAQLEAIKAKVTTPDSVAALGKPDIILVDQGFQGDTGATIAAQLAKEGRKVGLLRRADGSVVDAGGAFVLFTPVREYQLVQQFERLLSKRPTVNVPGEGTGQTLRQFGARVLVAEDNRVNQRVVRGLLERLGCAVTIVDNGVHAVDKISSGATFDLVLMDCQMPELDGFGATRRIRELKLAHVPIVALTAGAMDGEREKCLAAGMDEYLRKPVRLEELERTLARWLS